MSGLDMTEQPFKSVPKKIKDLQRRKRWSEALIFFFFILLSFGFWMLQSLQQDYEIGLSIPVRYKNVPPDVAFTTTPPEEVRVKVKDKGSVLLNYTIGRNFIPVEINMKKGAPSGELKLSRKELESDIQKQLMATTTLIGFEPQTISLKYNPRAKKEVPVVFNGDIQTEPGFLIDTVMLNPATVEVYASKAVLDTLASVRTKYIVVKRTKKKVTENIQIEKMDGVTVSPDVVTLIAQVEEYTEKTLEVPVLCTDLPAHLTLRTFPSAVQLTCNVPLSRFKDITENDFLVDVKYADLEKNLNGVLPVTLEKKPSWVKQVSLYPEKIEFVLEQNNIP